MYPMEYYRLPFCQPFAIQAHGSFLDFHENSPYRIQMKKDMYCEQVCFNNLGREEIEGFSLSKMIRAIRNRFHNNWIIDNFPSKFKTEKSHSHRGFPIGFVDPDTKLSYVYNHLNIELEYQEVSSSTSDKEYRIVGFTVEPFSIKHEFTPFMDDDDGETSNAFKFVNFENPIQSCDPNRSEKKHTAHYMINPSEHLSQPASGRVLFTYDVIWKENNDVVPTSSSKINLEISVGNTLTSAFFMLCLFAAIFIKYLYYRHNNRHNTTENVDSIEFVLLIDDEEPAEESRQY